MDTWDSASQHTAFNYALSAAPEEQGIPKERSVQAPSSWSAILDELELAVTAAEQALDETLGAELVVDPQATQTANQTATQAASAAPHQVWSPPLPAGPLPAEARDRALALAAAQERVSRRLEEARLNVSRQLQAISAVPRMSASSRAVYLDVSG